MKKFAGKLFFLIIIAFATMTIPLAAQPAGVTDTAYWDVVMQRAENIVTSLQLNDKSAEGRVQELIAMQYYNLNRIQGNGEASDSSVKALHREYLDALSKYLTPSQIDMVKDGMTYGVLQRTYNAYLALLPDLTESQKKYIMDNLVEARELAMDAGSAEEKHAWFGKYKGRINNYLSKAGYDLKKAEENLRKDADKKNNQY